MTKNRNIYSRIKYELTINPRDKANFNIDHPLAQDNQVNY
jgi:hypothetical protein